MIKTKMWVQTEGGFLILLAAMLLVLPLQWVLAATVAVAFHEACHFIAIRLLGGRIYGLRLGLGGAKMEVEPMPPQTEAVAALAGPIGSALLVLLARYAPRLAICGFIHCLFNLLPLFPLDGGRVLRGLLALFFPSGRAEQVFSRFQQVLWWILGAGTLLIAFQWGVFPALLCLCLLWRQRKKRTV